jgi:iron complex outermembrane receptor protein
MLMRRVLLAPLLSSLALAGVASAQTPTFLFPTVEVSAQKEPADPQRLPLPVTVVTDEMIQEAGLDTITGAGVYAPNTHFTEFTARKLSNARFRGIGASPQNPSITTYVDGVPQLNANTSNIELLDVDQIEFVRGPQSTLFGRNTLGGVINVSTRRPGLGGDWTGRAQVPLGNYDERGLRAAASGPIRGDVLAAGVAFSYVTRDGFTRNLVTGRTLDDREAFAAKGQLLWKPTAAFEARVIVSGERDRDGDYALSDLGGLRARPFETMRDVEGLTERDILSTSIQTRWEGGRLSLSTITGLVRWQTDDQTDLDYLPIDLATRRNAEESVQFTQEVRVASAEASSLPLGSGARLAWQAGALLFTQNYDQDSRNTYSPFLISSQFGFPVAFAVVEQSPLAALDDVGIGVYGQGTVTIGDALDLVAGVRADRESREASLRTATSPMLLPPTSLDEERTFTDVSPQFAAAYRLSPERSVFGLVSRGYKAGGFNAVALPGDETYDEEHTWNVEGGFKGLWAGGRVATNVSLFRIDWDDLQFNLPHPFVPGQFLIANAAAATSSGAEVEVRARPVFGVDLFGSLGYTRARFDDGVVLGGAAVGGNDVPNTPDFTANAGVQLTRAIRPWLTGFVRAETDVHGAYHYDEANTEGQETYALAHLRGGVRVGVAVVEAYVRNAFDERYIPVAFEYRSFAPSGFIGEMGRPRTFGVNLGVQF